MQDAAETAHFENHASSSRARLVTQDGEVMMRHSECLAKSVVFVVLLLFASTGVAHAYVDPGTGSYVIQILIAALAASAFAVRIYWGKIKGLFSKSSPDTQDPGDDAQ